MAELMVGDIVMTCPVDLKDREGKIIQRKEDQNPEKIKVLSLLGEGGQGWVYKVEYQGKPMALKWYKDCGRDPQAFYKNVRENVTRGTLAPQFLWPLAITEQTHGAFGYVMELRPQGFYELSDFLLAKVRFADFRAEVEACIQVVNAFRILHNEGLSYQDLNDGNFFINPRTGAVLIADNDNVAPNKTNMGIVGKPRYMAPEIVLGKNMPDTQSDRFSLATVLFAMLCLGHPLEGKKWAAICQTPKEAERLYGSTPLFVFDKKDNSNRPIPEQANVLNRWKYLPEYIRDLFYRSYSEDTFTNPMKRVKELEWLKAFTRFRSEIVPCECGNEVFLCNASSTICEKCNKMINITHRIQFPEYAMATTKGARIYRCQMGICNADEALMPIALLVAKNDDPNTVGLKNMTKQIWEAQTPSGRINRVEPGHVVPFLSGIKIKVFNHSFELK